MKVITSLAFQISFGHFQFDYFYMDKQKLLGRYQILEKVGEGAYGAVYKAMDPKIKEVVALKMSNCGGEEEGIPSTTLRQISILKSIRHTNIVKLHGINFCKEKEGTMIQLVFQYIEEDLAKFIRRRKCLRQPQYKKIFYQLVMGLKYLHDRKIYHRDLKPQNVLINKEGDVKIADFGLSRIIYCPDRTFSKEIETLWYRSPELLLGAKYYGMGVDIWSLGCILYQLAEGTVLFKGDSQVGQMFKIFEFLGTPRSHQWPDLHLLPYFKKSYPKMISKTPNFRNLSKDGIELLYGMLRQNPCSRLTIDEIINHKYFDY